MHPPVHSAPRGHATFAAIARQCGSSGSKMLNYRVGSRIRFQLFLGRYEEGIVRAILNTDAGPANFLEPRSGPRRALARVRDLSGAGAVPVFDRPEWTLSI
jgi:hypothetical protein